MERGTTRPVFWDVDTLYDFMRSDGKPYVPGSEEIIRALKALTAFARAHRIPIDWKTTFPPHVMRGIAGQRKIVQTALVDPHTLDVFSNANVSTLLATLAPKAIVAPCGDRYLRSLHHRSLLRDRSDLADSLPADV